MPVSRKVLSFYRQLYYTQGPNLTGQIQKIQGIQERRWETVHQVWSECSHWEKVKNAFKGTKKRKYKQGTFEKIDVSKSEESGQSFDDNDASNKSDDSWSSGSNKNYLSKTKYYRKKIKKNSFLILDECIDANFNYESLRSHLTSHLT